MTTHRLDELLLQLNPLLRVRRHHHYLGMNDGVYFRGKYICAVPQGPIFRAKHEAYRERYWGQIPHTSVDNLARTLVSNNCIKGRQYWTLMRG